MMTGTLMPDKTKSFWNKLKEAKYLLFIATSTLFLVASSTKVGTGADSEIDTQMIRWNMGELGLIPQVSQLSGRFEGVPIDSTLTTIMSSYGFTILTINELLALLIERIIGHPLGLDNYYLIRNLLSVLIMILCAHAIGRIVQSLIKKDFFHYLLGYLSALLLPALSGNALFNIKDLPVAAAIACGIAASLLVIQGKENLNSYEKFEIFCFSTFAVVLSAGTRPAAIAIGLLPLAVQITGSAFQRIFPNVRLGSRLPSIYQVTGTLLGLSLVTLTNASALSSPIGWYVNSIRVSGDFPWTGAVLAAGEIYRVPDIPIMYWATVLVGKTPLLFLLLLTFGSVLVVSDKKIPALSKLIVFTPMFGLLPVIVMDSIIYDNARHLMYVQVGISILASYGFGRLVDWGRNNSKFSLVASGFTMALALKLLFDLASLYPYTYVYVNEVAQNADLENRWDFDYYGVSGKETQEFINNNFGSINQAAIFGQSFGPYMENNINEVGTSNKPLDVYSQIWRPAIVPDYFDECPMVFKVTRQLNGREILLSYARDCRGVETS